MKRITGLFIIIFIIIPVVLLSWLTLTESGLNLTYQLTRPLLPSELSIHKLQGRLIGPVTIDNIEYSQKTALVKVSQLTVDWKPLSLLTAKIDFNQLHAQSLDIILSDSTKPGPAETKTTSLPEINLPWRMQLTNTKIENVNIRQGDQHFDIQQIQLDASSLFSQLDINRLSIIKDNLTLNIKGELRATGQYRHNLNIDWQTSLTSGFALNGKGQLIGNMKTTRLNQHVQGLTDLSLNAELNNLLDKLDWQLKVNANKFNPQQVNKAWPALSNTVITMDAKGDLNTVDVKGHIKALQKELGPIEADFKLLRLKNNIINIEHIKLHATNNDIHLDSKGVWRADAKGGEIDLTFDWKNLRWPLQDETRFSSTAGQGTIRGTKERYNITLTSPGPVPQLAVSSWNIKADGNINGLNINAIQLKMLDGDALVKGKLTWSPILSWEADARVSNFNPAKLFPQWPGKLNAELSSQGRFKNNQLSAEVFITDMNGTLRDYPVLLNCELNWHQQGLDINQFNFHSGDSVINIKGRVGETQNLKWNLMTKNLEELYPQALGQITSNGHLSGTRKSPTIQATINGKDLSFQSNTIGAIDGNINIDLFRWQKIDIQLGAQALKYQTHTVNSLNINADSQQLQVNAQSDVASAQLILLGKIDNNGWKGRIEQASIQSAKFSNWQLKAPANLNLNEQSLLLDKTCWNSDQSASFCTSINRQTSIWKSDINMNRFPLSFFSPWLPPDMKFTGLMDATANLQFNSPTQLIGDAHITLPSGVLSYPLMEGEHERWEYRSGTLSASLNEQGIKISSKIDISNGDNFTFKAELPGAHLLSLDRNNQNIKAEAHSSIHDLGLIEALIPEIQDLKGDVKLNASMNGTLAQPRFSGQAHLLNGAFRIPRLGLSIDQLNLRSHSDDLNKLKFNLDAHSGEGKLTIQGITTLNKNTGWPTEISIKGKHFEVSNIPEARIHLSPDLQIKMQNHNIDISGKAHIPYAKLQPKDITTAAQVSADAVIIGIEQPIEIKWLINTRIRVTLGDRVNFFGYGFEGRFGGNVLLLDEPGQLTTAVGEITVPEGRYRAYGQRLDVEHGRLLYTGGPLSNPGLDLRAVRHTNNVVAGIKVRGSLKEPQLELFSIPSMGQSDALSYLLLGRPMESSTNEEGAMMAKAALALGLSGGDQLARILGDRFGFDEMRVESSDKGDQASLVVGRYLSPKLYVSYGVGLIEAINTLSLRYQISDKWQLKAESGDYTGADILYTIER